MFAPSDVFLFGSFIVFMTGILYIVRRFSRAVDKVMAGDNGTEQIDPPPVPPTSL